ncbi:DUF445 domain-containing protein [Taibaiella chishuiensis]|uniref:Uncharacterized membrane-anchored protein YjiN (DUF445 family) n=1 Tax=Taibaiella chishuiensis TaxID=1434707 RepID=A0A2P8D6F1_9BACT|nr:DUF445 domain-containing protein [Taibaiella chishuiensis]PSK92792.1 uncharacterized membrane-anchored protein YjiN (DUF445 family) [Taibaiella chishuiensis]
MNNTIANPESRKVIQLRRHKQLATGLFLLMLLVYIAATWYMARYTTSWMGYIKAFAEAAMVGALADWFAVTALFHHPLGLPIPHTNLIERSKKNIGNNLGDFVVSNFLSPANIRPYIRKITVASYVGDWLDRPRNKELLLNEGMRLFRDIIAKMDDHTVAAFIAKKGTALIGQVQLNQVVAGALQYFLERGEQEQLITLLAAKIKNYIGSNETMVQERVKKESYFFIPKFVDQKVAAKIAGGLVRYFEEIETDPQHKIRQEIAQQLEQFVGDLRTQPRWQQELEQLKSGLLSDDKVMQYADDIWQSLKQTLTEELSAPGSGIHRYFARALDDLSQSLRADALLQERIDRWIRHTAYKYILRNTGNVALLISNTVGNWQGRELSRKLELEVGKDLQFIRINGTIVGGLVGLLIYTITRLIS